LIHRLGRGDAAEANALAERDFPGIDLTEFLANPLNVCLTCGDSGTLFAWRGPGIYEAHVFYSVRGREALKIAEQVLRHMREHHQAWLFWALVPAANRATRMFARLVGWHSLGLRETADGTNELFCSEMAPCLQ
jgi:hypothetical protein